VVSKPPLPAPTEADVVVVDEETDAVDEEADKDAVDEDTDTDAVDEDTETDKVEADPEAGAHAEAVEVEVEVAQTAARRHESVLLVGIGVGGLDGVFVFSLLFVPLLLRLEVLLIDALRLPSDDVEECEAASSSSSSWILARFFRVRRDGDADEERSAR